MNQQSEMIGKLMKSDYQFVFTLGTTPHNSTIWYTGPLQLKAIVPWGWFAAQELWKDCEAHWR